MLGLGLRMVQNQIIGSDGVVLDPPSSFVELGRPRNARKREPDEDAEGTEEE